MISNGPAENLYRRGGHPEVVWSSSPTPFLWRSWATPIRRPAQPVQDPGASLDRSFLEGTSPIDLVRLAMMDRRQAREFIRNYGYDLEDELERAELVAVHREAVDFLRRLLCPAPRKEDRSLALPAIIAQPKQLADLLVLASRDPAQDPLQPWGCAVLRVMHAIGHANHVAGCPFYDEVKEQILGRYRQHLHQDGEQVSLGRRLDKVELVGFQLREEKSRDSLILKLLHKADNLPQSVYDHVGVKLITPTKTEALAALRYIRRHNLANFAHLTPGRSRNTLLDFAEDPATVVNPHSSPDFRSIQFTCQQLIKVTNPAHDLVEKIKQRVGDEDQLEDLLTQLVGHLPERQSFFFPYEVQILDQENHLKTLSGESSHANYRLRQLRAARVRVLGRLVGGR